MNSQHKMYCLNKYFAEFTHFIKYKQFMQKKKRTTFLKTY